MQSVSQSKNKPTDPRNKEVVHAAGDPQIGNLATPINASGLAVAYINSLPAYRPGLTPLRRGLEVGLSHGYWLIGPFTQLGPLRNTDLANLVGLISTIGLVIISTLSIALYAATHPPGPIATLTTPQPPEALKTSEGWNAYASGFLIGGIGGAVLAFLILSGLAVL